MTAARSARSACGPSQRLTSAQLLRRRLQRRLRRRSRASSGAAAALLRAPMLPVVALVGRPNVGKSTLFNVLTGTRDAIVADVPGLTRDRQYGFGRLGPAACVVIDTGGLVENPVGIETQMRIQTERAVQKADRLVLLADARSGVTTQDPLLARVL